MERLNTVVSDEIYAILGRRRMSLAQLSRATGIAQQTLWRRLNGPYALSLDDLAKISRALDLPITDLMPKDAERVFYGNHRLRAV